MRISADTKYWLMRIGSVAAIVGSILAGVGNVLHPVTPDDPVGVAQVIAESALSSCWAVS